tara:strand:+ start:45 stop:302 length:258 start_codon:yes stop_codon:yes gene_type:complete
MNQKLKLNKGEITIDRMTGLAFRDGKVLGRKNWIVQTETSLTIKQEVIIKAIDQNEAEQKAIDTAERMYPNKNPYVEVTACWSPD